MINSSIIEKIDRKKVLLILEWCCKKFGKSKYWKDYPHLRVCKSKGISIDGDVRYGHSIQDKITIFLGSHDTVKELCGTVIHEYKHYLLSDNEYYAEIKKMKKRGMNEKSVYKIHPHEKMAKRFENKWMHVCYHELQKKLNEKE